MDTQAAYDRWSQTYDEVINKTRDLEAKAFRKILSDLTFSNCLEIGCGTGKNTVWLAENATRITAIDLSSEMLQKAKAKITASHVRFEEADINEPWSFTDEKYDLISFSLVLEHIKDLKNVFLQSAKFLNKNGHLYVGELHPFKQYSGSKARFETENGVQVVQCFNHHISEFISGAAFAGLQLTRIEEYFDDDNAESIPRILALVLRPGDI